MRPIPDLRRLCLASLAMVALVSPAIAQEPTRNALRPQARTDNGWWMKRHKAFVDRIKKGDVGLLFIGDSITQGWEGNSATWDRFYGPRKAVNLGIGGDQTGQVLWRLEHGEIDGIRPKVAVLMIGTNNLGSDAPSDIAEGIETIVKTLRDKLPETSVLLLGIFPRGEKPNPDREKIKVINDRISRLDNGKHVQYLDIGSTFLNGDGSISKEIMPDFLHLSGRGYRRWADAIEPTLWSMMDEK